DVSWFSVEDGQKPFCKQKGLEYCQWNFLAFRNLILSTCEYYWKSNAETLKGKYSKQFLNSLHKSLPTKNHN
ncbi:MAG: hypothetical protein KAT65_29400, partial [Methanophagales archaeon]|nr:hypothetical protein [Methanophagales archaeon]